MIESNANLINNYKDNHQEFLDTHLLSSKIISHYDLKKTKMNVVAMLDNYIELQYKFINISAPRITTVYEIRYNQFNSGKSDPISYYSERKFDTELEVKKLYNEINEVLIKMTREELMYYNENLLKKVSEERIAERLGLSRKG